MLALRVLPPAFLGLVFSSLLSFALATPPPTSTNDPFKAIAVHVVKPPSPPICCLVQPASPEPPADILLSFEEWKEKRSSSGDGETIVLIQDGVGASSGNLNGGGSEKVVEGGDASSSTAVETPNPVVPPADDYAPSPHFRVPITDRFNYAGVDCSARVHTSHRTAKSALSILSYKRDKYMLSPCRDKEKFVVVELCDDIRIDTVQLANFEFFSGVFKEFTVSVAKTYTTDPEGWTFAGSYTAKNIRVVQSFHPPTTLRDFYRFIRIDFQSHYGNEYYCPVSLLRVYGLTHLEEYKWDVWQEESRARSSAASASSASTAASTPIEVSEPEPAPAPEIRLPPSYSEYVSASAGAKEGEQVDIQHPDTAIGQLPLPSISDEEQQPAMQQTNANADPKRLPSPEICESSSGSSSPSSSSSSMSTTTSSSVTEQAKIQTPFESEGATSSKAASYSSTSVPSSATISSVSSTLTSTSAEVSSSTLTDSEIPPLAPSVASVASASTTPSSNPNPNSNSIYRTIMNRLSALEANHTLFSHYMEEHRVYTRYVEEHTAAVRELLRRVSEDMGRAEGVARGQAQKWDRQRKRVDAEQRELIARVEYLNGEIILEKRLGVAQLLLLLAVLVFLTLTRGSPSTTTTVVPVGVQASSSLRAWGRRHLSLKSLSSRSRSTSGDWDWVGRLKQSQSLRGEAGVNIKREDTEDGLERTINANVEFPSMDDEKPLHIPIVAPIPISASTARPSTLAATPDATPNTTPSRHKPSRLNLQTQGALGLGHRPRTRSVGNNTLVFEGNAKPRSRTPTTLGNMGMARTPHRRAGTPTHMHGYYGPVHSHSAHPSSSSHPSSSGPFPMTHSISQGSHAGPRSARKWARTAHLHELRSPAVMPRANVPAAPPVVAQRAEGGRPARVVSDKTASSEGDIFASMSPSPAPMAFVEVEAETESDAVVSGSGRASTARWGIGMLHLHHGLAPPPLPPPSGDVFGGDFGYADVEGNGEGDGDSQWVDTDDGESEVGDEIMMLASSPRRIPAALGVAGAPQSPSPSSSRPPPPKTRTHSVSSSVSSSSPSRDPSSSHSSPSASSPWVGQVTVGA
ncbi:UNC-like C-terminal-domain-containing protein [Mycena amicta]|nr:UNC-like C-terminal-domain-containing protein [Mycena amicta]